MINPTTPHSIEAEKAILGAVLLDNKAIAKLTIPVEAFYVGAHRTIYAAMRKLEAKQQPIDLLGMSDALGDALTAIGGLNTLLELSDSVISAINIDRYEALVIQKWQRRKLIALCRELQDKAADSALEWDDIRHEADAKLTDAISANASAKGLTAIGEIIPTIWAQIDQGVSPATSTGLSFLDQCLGGGLRGGELIVIAARPAMGKTFVGQFVARLFAEQKPVALFSMEMDAISMVKRFWATEANLPQTQLTSNSVSNGCIDALVQAASTLSALKIYVDDTPGSLVSPAHIESECNKLKRQHGDLGCVVVDYLQLIGDQGSSNRVGELGRYSSALKSLSKTFNCPVIALSQLSRGVEGRNDKRPVMSDIRSSGAIEQDADVVIMLYRDEYYNPDTRDEGVLELIIAKNRHGKSGVTAKANFDPSVGTITNFVNYSAMGA
jgi:replicative DNA helicase